MASSTCDEVALDDLLRRLSHAELLDLCFDIVPEKPILSILRHAQSTFNAKQENCDEYDADLSPLGEQQAATLEGDFDLVVCSPMRCARRTLELSQITARKNIPLEAAREVKAHKSDLLAAGELLETTEMAMERVMHLRTFLKEVAEDGKKVLLLAHRNLIIYLTSDMVLADGKLTGNFSSGLELDNAELVTFPMEW